VVAHGVGGAQHLPIPAAYAIAGAGAALAPSFLVLLIAWRKPRFDAATTGVWWRHGSPASSTPPSLERTRVLLGS